jgi:hypothetical protein
MAVLDLATRGAACPSQSPSPANRATRASRERKRSRIAAEIGGTLLVLMLIAVGVLALRFGLVLANGFLH